MDTSGFSSTTVSVVSVTPDEDLPQNGQHLMASEEQPVSTIANTTFRLNRLNIRGKADPVVDLLISLLNIIQFPE
jgi:hypothetical protein